MDKLDKIPGVDDPLGLVGNFPQSVQHPFDSLELRILAVRVYSNDRMSSGAIRDCPSGRVTAPHARGWEPVVPSRPDFLASDTFLDELVTEAGEKLDRFVPLPNGGIHPLL
jgi:hypothetical protein